LAICSSCGIEQAIISALQTYLAETKLQRGLDDAPVRFDRAALAALPSRIEVRRNQLVVSLRPTKDSTEPAVFSIPWQKPSSKRLRRLLVPHGTSRANAHPERADRRVRLVCAIAHGRRWLDDIIAGSVSSPQQLAQREQRTVRQVNLTLSLAFLAPQLVKAAVEGRLPRGINIERLRDPDAEWSRQFQELGLNPH
jgi:site-specific DNA recombinase